MLAAALGAVVDLASDRRARVAKPQPGGVGE
jgi:hypothetical protein